MGDVRLSESELYIMRQFWRAGAMGTDALAPLVASRRWRPTTLLTFLGRLVKKGMLTVERQGKKNLYSPAVTEAQYANGESHTLLEDLYGGSALNFLAAMVDSRGISAEEVAALRRWLNEQEVGRDE